MMGGSVPLYVMAHTWRAPIFEEAMVDGETFYNRQT